MSYSLITGKHSSTSNANCTTTSTSTTPTVSSVKRGSSSHRRDKTKDKQHSLSVSGDKCHKVNSSLSSELNGRSPVSQSTPRTSTFPALSSNTPNVPGPGAPVGEAGTSTSSSVANGSEQNVSPPVVTLDNNQTSTKSSATLSTLAKPLQSTSPPPTNKIKTANSSTSASLAEQKVYNNYIFNYLIL